MSAPDASLPTSSIESDETVLTLRSGGKSFSAIARELGFDRSSMAVAAFNRALRNKQPEEQQRIRAEETARLEVLEAAVENHSDADDETRRKRLAALERMRSKLLAE